ncbi:MAG TPA: hypothetical protein VHW09_26620 [Bryobacteraceae bacterium]|jgi:hypothetical protein|nr:hypothetical protein [Bryobacteraceae bacterium]
MKLYIVMSALAIALPAAAADFDLGLVGITPFETARMNAFCDGSVTPTPCDITFEVHDTNGNVLKQVSMILQPETTASVDYVLRAAIAFPARVEIDPCWKVLRGSAQLSLELIENLTQRTHLLINWAAGAAPRSTADVDFGATGITRFDTARMGAACAGDSTDDPACDVLFEFHDAAGNVLKSARMSIRPGASAFLDLNISDTSAAGGRVTIDPCWTVAGGAAVVDLQTIDRLTGMTVTQAFPAAFATAAAIVP